MAEFYKSTFSGAQIDEAIRKVTDNVVVLVTAQSLSIAEKVQARENIGAISSTELVDNTSDIYQFINAIHQYVLRYDEQTLTEEQQAQARTNIGAASSDELTETADSIYEAIANNGTANETALNTKQDTLTGTPGQVVGFDADGNAVAQNAPSAVEYVEQELTEEQKTQARTNIGAASAADLISNTETWTFELSDGSVVTKQVVVAG